MERAMKITASLFLVAAVACGGSTQSNAHGTASYAKPPDQGGKPVGPQQKSDDLKVTVIVSGAGNFDRVNQSLCSLTSGSFTEQAQTSGSLSSNGAYVASYTNESASSTIVNPTCGLLKNLHVTNVTTLAVVASIPANDQNCAAYCDAKASTSCSASDSTCIANTTASCKANCKGSQKISGAGSLSSTGAADVNSKLGNGSGAVDAKVDVVLDTLTN
jgi:hypothetical protein